MSVLVGARDNRKPRLVILGTAMVGLAIVLALLTASSFSPLRADDPGEGPIGGPLAQDVSLGLEEVDPAALELLQRDTGGSSLAGPLQPAQTVDLYTYSAKGVCAPTLGNAGGALVPGTYKTAINVHNPGSEPALIKKWVVLSPPQGQDAIRGGVI